MSDLIIGFPSQIVFGTDAINRIGHFVSQYGNRCLIITESVLRQNGTIERIEELLDRRSISTIVYDEIGPGATSAGLDDIISMARASQVLVVMGVGGMRVLSAARMVSTAVDPDVEIRDVLGGRPPAKSSAAYIEVPSSYRNHFMLRSECLVTDATTRAPLMVQLPPGTTKCVIVDPNLTLSLSPKYATAAMMDTLLAAVEGYISTRSSFYSDTLMLRAIELLGASLGAIAETPEEPRLRIRAGEAGLLTAMGLAASSQGVGGALAYAINSRYAIPKSWIATVILPHLIDTSAQARPEKLRRVAEALGEEMDEQRPGEAAYHASAMVRRVIGQMELPGRLRDMDLAIDDLVDVSESAAELELSANAPTPHTTGDLYDLVKQAF